MTLISTPAPLPTKKTFSEILDLLDEVDVDGTGYLALCPHHGDTNPSLRVAFNGEQRRVLVRCRVGCKTEDVLADLGLTMFDLNNVEPGGEVVTTRTETPEVSPKDIAALRTYLDRTVAEVGPALEYAQRRFGLDADDFERLHLGYDDGHVAGGTLVLSQAAYHDVPRLVVPFFRFDGVAHYVQARALEGEPKARWSGPVNPDGAAWGKYGFFAGTTGWAEVVITEGPGDALTAVAHGYDTVLIRGAGLASNQALLDDVATNLRGRRIVVAGDTDEAGRKFTEVVSQALASKGLSVYTLDIPGQVSDLTEWRERIGASEFPTAFIRAVQRAGVVVQQTTQAVTKPVIGEVDADATTDVDRAALVLAFARSTGRDIVFIEGIGWHIWSGTVWETASEDRVRGIAHQAGKRVREMGLEAHRQAAAALDADDQKRLEARAKAIMSCAGTLCSTRGVTALLVVLRSSEDVRATIDQFDQQKDALGVGNGIVNLRTGQIRPYTKEDRLTRRLDVEYHGDVAPGLWSTFLSQIFLDEDLAPDPDYVAFVQRLIGYGITGENRDHVFPILYGEGRNGKSRFLEALKVCFSGISRTTSMSTFEEKAGSSATPELVPLRWARLVMASESGADRKFDEARIKAITGGEEIQARDLYQAPIEFMPAFLVLLATNHRPGFRGQDEGLWRRVKMLPFRAHFAEGSASDDPRLDEKLAADTVQREILAWAIAGAMRWYDGGLKVPASISAETDDYRTEQDRLAEFFGANLDVTGEHAHAVKGTEVWQAYLAWATDTGEPHVLGRNTFLHRVATLPGVTSFIRSKVRWFRGVRILSQAEAKALAAEEERAVRG